ncbi:LysR family transcriptional regulator [Marivita sp. GX14005]|uniref:LysR family transcriptional regulator n=1 Tax=Marivita sp. GX14005 TaxID=2942276 RepID=UPI0020188C0B|nr:LysR family transcriptional regulator [Marivita sp. GX14005]MCL3883370.1 LysR family transcriptional regulator [Marivita sp. GX14005]
MRLEWIDDILAVLDGGSLVSAAERRFLTQSAFTRRVRMIEDALGTPLFDRRRKPVTLLPGVAALEPELRDLSARLKRLSQDLRLSAKQAERPLVLACQHAITATVSPLIVQKLTAEGETSVRVRSGNRDECLTMLVSNDADFAIMYDLPGNRAKPPMRAFDEVQLGTDALVPVCTPRIARQARSGEVPVIGYPPDVFFGQVFNRAIVPRMPDGTTLSIRAETSLTLAILQFVQRDIGIAWLPQSLVEDHLTSRTLLRLSDRLPEQRLEIRLIRLAEDRGAGKAALWDRLVSRFTVPPI